MLRLRVAMLGRSREAAEFDAVRLSSRRGSQDLLQRRPAECSRVDRKRIRIGEQRKRSLHLWDLRAQQAFSRIAAVHLSEEHERENARRFDIAIAPP